MRRALLLTLASPLMLLLLGSPAASAIPAAAAQSSFSYNWTGGATAPVLFSGNPNWDVSIHSRGMSEAMDQTLAQHGADCAAPPAIHMIDQLAQGVYICKNHLMTSISDRGFGDITLTPNQIIDFSQGTATVTFNLSTLRFNSRNWLTFWLSPWDQNILHPFTDAVDLQGPPRTGVRITGTAGNSNSQKFAAEEILNFNVASSVHANGTALEQLMPPSAVTRTKFELDISRTHIRFGIPSVNLWWVDNDFPTPLSFNQALFQINDESYDPCKDQQGGPCSPDTWHWSDFNMSPTVPFTMLQGDTRFVSPATSPTVHFASPAPAGSFLRFEEIGPNPRVGFDGGAMQPAVMQQQSTHQNDRWASFWMPVPAGTTSATFAADGWWGGPWWFRDPSIWALTAPLGPPPVQISPPAPTPGGNPTPSASPTGITTPPPGGGDESPAPTGGGEESPGATGGGDESSAPGGGGEKPPSGGGGGEKPPSGGGGGESAPVSSDGEHQTPASVATNVKVHLDAALHSPTAPVLGVLGLVGVLLLLFVVRSIWKSRRPGENPPS